MKILPVRILEPRLRRMCKLWLEGLMVGFQARISSSLNSPFLEQPFARFHAREKNYFEATEILSDHDLAKSNNAVSSFEVQLFTRSFDVLEI